MDMEGTGRAHGRCAASVDGQKRMECGGWLAARNRPEQSQEGETWRSRQLWRWAACSSPLAPLPGYAWLPACRISVWLHRICLKRADKGPRQQSAVPVNPWLRSPDVDRLHPAAGHAVGQPVPKHGANQRPEMRDTPATLAACLVAWAASNNISRLPITHKTQLRILSCRLVLSPPPSLLLDFPSHSTQAWNLWVSVGQTQSITEVPARTGGSHVEVRPFARIAEQMSCVTRIVVMKTMSRLATCHRCCRRPETRATAPLVADGTNYNLT